MLPTLQRKNPGDPFDVTMSVLLQGGGSVAALVRYRSTAAWSCTVTHRLCGRLFVVSSQSCVWVKPRGEHCRPAAQSPLSASWGHLWRGKPPASKVSRSDIRSDDCWLVFMGFINLSVLPRTNILNTLYQKQYTVSACWFSFSPRANVSFCPAANSEQYGRVL